MMLSKYEIGSMKLLKNMKTKQKMKKYYIRETWRISGTIEKHNEKTDPNSNIVASLNDVKKWIIDWIETWIENAEENEYIFMGYNTDYKTFAKLKIKTGEFCGIDLVDHFSLKIKSNKV